MATKGNHPRFLATLYVYVDVKRMLNAEGLTEKKLGCTRTHFENVTATPNPSRERGESGNEIKSRDEFVMR